jgi:hypothetical protein
MVSLPLYMEQHLSTFALVADMGVAMAMDVDRRKGHFMGHLILLHR